MVANLAPELERRETPEPGELLPPSRTASRRRRWRSRAPRTCKETDREGTLRKLVVLAFEGKARRVDIGDDALWIPV